MDVCVLETDAVAVVVCEAVPDLEAEDEAVAVGVPLLVTVCVIVEVLDGVPVFVCVAVIVRVGVEVCVVVLETVGMAVTDAVTDPVCVAVCEAVVVGVLEIV